MQYLTLLLLFLGCNSCATARQTQQYTGSTPAGPEIRRFLGISPGDSVDFVRWNLDLDGTRYTLRCNYGISKANTNGFIDGGKKLSCNGSYEQQGPYYRLVRGTEYLQLASINNNLLHLIDREKHLLRGNAGWSYTLNNLHPAPAGKLNLIYKPDHISDSLVLLGRTPCGIASIPVPGTACYKLKWKIVLYNGDNKTYFITGTPWRQAGGKSGRWNLAQQPNGQLVYQLNNGLGKPFINLLQIDDGVFIFTDDDGSLLVGNLDFSYTLNRHTDTK